MGRAGNRSAFLKNTVIYLCLAALPLASWSCSEQKQQNGERKAPVETTAAAQKDVPIEVLAIGEMEALSSVEVRSRVDGHILEVHFNEGQYVNRGDLLFTIDPRPFEVILKRAEAQLAKDRALYENALVDAARYKDLVDKGYVAKAQYDQFRTTAEALKATVDADAAAVEEARLVLGYCRIKAPISGKTGSAPFDTGNIVRADDDALVAIYQIDPINVLFTVPEQGLPEIKRYMDSAKPRVLVHSAGEETPYEGSLTFIDNAVDRSTGTIRLKGTIKNPERVLWPGQFVNVSLRLSIEKGAVTIPTRAVMTGQNGQYVFVIKDDMTAESRPIEAGRAHQDETVISKGLSPGEAVVTDGALQLVPGIKVDIRNAGTGKKAE